MEGMVTHRKKEKKNPSDAARRRLIDQKEEIPRTKAISHYRKTGQKNTRYSVAKETQRMAQS